MPFAALQGRMSAWNRHRYPDDGVRITNNSHLIGARAPVPAPRTQVERDLASQSFVALTRMNNLDNPVEATKANETRAMNQADIDAHPTSEQMKAERLNVIYQEPPKDSVAQDQKHRAHDISNHVLDNNETLHKLKALRDYIRDTREFKEWAEAHGGTKMANLGSNTAVADQP